MKEIIENGAIYNVSDNYPSVPYVKYLKVDCKRYNLSKYEFRSKFTMNEQVEIAIVAKTDPVIEVFLENMNIAEFIDLHNPQISQGLDYMISINFISQARKTEILTGI